ncbi:hypothetical protein OY671_011187, partial [Metschnikowia pulcherrima]
MQSGKFDLNDSADQIGQMQKLGGMGGIMGMMPGMGKMKDQMAAAGLDDSIFKRQLAIISSMTAAERTNPDLLKHSRKQRIAKGSGTNAAVVKRAVDAGVVYFSPWAAAAVLQKISGRSPSSFTTTADYDTTAKAGLGWMIDENKAKKVGLIFQEGP